MEATRVRYLVFVPIKWGETINDFKVEIEHDHDLTESKIEAIKATAREYVESRGQTIIDDMPVKIYRKK